MLYLGVLETLVQILFLSGEHLCDENKIEQSNREYVINW